jgi:predicted HNH restriction endonuclease
MTLKTNSNMIFNNDIKEDYLLTKESLSSSFNEASEFLDFIEKLNSKGFHVGTHKNLHLYYKDRFLFYFKKVSPESIRISSKPNGIIKSQTEIYSDHFFTLLNQELKSNNSNYWREIEYDKNGNYKITVSKSAESTRFFYHVKNTLAVIEQEESSNDLSNQILQVIKEYQIYNNEEEAFIEGIKKVVTNTYYERNPRARKRCLQFWGYTCVVCGFNFQETYGRIGEDYIHVHHLIPISEVKQAYEVDPIKDLRPVCPNCHAMIHSKKEAISIEKLKKIIENNKV